MIRLFANMMAGHAIILSFTFVIFMTWQISTTMGSIFTVFSSLLMIFLNCLELLVASSKPTSSHYSLLSLLAYLCQNITKTKK